jgi:DNA-binding transcriptional MerR regulator
LRFWETRFPQVKPLKRAGGRRFYRPEDVALLRAVQALLYGEGYTIKGVQRLLAEFGPRHVAEALARSRGASPPVTIPERDEAEGRDGEEESGSAMPKDEPPRRVGSGPEAPARPVRMREEPTPARSSADGTIADRLAGVLVDLAECARLLSSVRAL